MDSSARRDQARIEDSIMFVTTSVTQDYEESQEYLANAWNKIDSSSPSSCSAGCQSLQHYQQSLQVSSSSKKLLKMNSLNILANW